MSTAGLVRAALARDESDLTRSDVGRGSPGSLGGNDSDGATVPDLLVTMLPTGIVTGYTAFTSTLLVAIEASNAGSEYLLARWSVFGLMVSLVLVVTYQSYRAERAKLGITATNRDRNGPWAELVGTAAAATVWGTTIPGSPLIAAVPAGFYQFFWPGIVGFGAVGLAMASATKMQTKVTARSKKPGTQTGVGPANQIQTATQDRTT